MKENKEQFLSESYVYKRTKKNPATVDLRYEDMKQNKESKHKCSQHNVSGIPNVSLSYKRSHDN